MVPTGDTEDPSVMGQTITDPVPVESRDDPLTGSAHTGPWQARLVLLSAIWGSSFLLIKVSVESVAPLHVAMLRMGLGAAILLAVTAWRRDPFPRGLRVWGHLLIASLLLNVLPFSLFAYGETHVTSVLAGIWNATTPLVTLPVAMVMLSDESPTASRVMGLLVGFLGVLIVLGVWTGMGGQALLGNMACFAASASYGFGYPYARRYLTGLPVGVVPLAAGQLLCGTAVLVIITPFVEPAPHSVEPQAVAAIVALGLVGTGFAYILNYGIVRDAGATAASTVAYLLPLFSTLEGVLFLSEPLSWNEPAGALIVIVGVAMCQGKLTGLFRHREVWRRDASTGHRPVGK